MPLFILKQEHFKALLHVQQANILQVQVAIHAKQDVRVAAAIPTVLVASLGITLQVQAATDVQPNVRVVSKDHLTVHHVLQGIIERLLAVTIQAVPLTVAHAQRVVLVVRLQHTVLLVNLVIRGIVLRSVNMLVLSILIEPPL